MERDAIVLYFKMINHYLPIEKKQKQKTKEIENVLA